MLNAIIRLLNVLHLQPTYRERCLTFFIFAGLILLSVIVMGLPIPQIYLSRDLPDLGHHFIPALIVIAPHAAKWIWWLGSESLEIIYMVIVLRALFTGKGQGLVVAIALVAVVHAIGCRLTVMPIPQHLMWSFPLYSLEIPAPNDFLFSGHAGNAVLLILFCRKDKKIWRALAWLYAIFIIWLVLATRVHYTADVASGIFAAYWAYRIGSRLQIEINQIAKIKG